MMYLRIGTGSFMANSRWHSWLILPGARHSYGSKHCDCELLLVLVAEPIAESLLTSVEAKWHQS